MHLHCQSNMKNWRKITTQFSANKVTQNLNNVNTHVDVIVIIVLMMMMNGLQLMKVYQKHISCNDTYLKVTNGNNKLSTSNTMQSSGLLLDRIKKIQTNTKHLDASDVLSSRVRIAINTPSIRLQCIKLTKHRGRFVCIELNSEFLKIHGKMIPMKEHQIGEGSRI